MRQNAFYYSASGPSRWLRRAAALVDHELAALCRVHWLLRRATGRAQRASG